jgi:hypothetical protein
VWHWTAGGYTPNKTDLAAYHFVVDGDGRWHRGVDVAKNSGSLKSGYAAHTLNLNTDSIGVSLACMAGATESPFNAGKYPMRAAQVDSLIAGCAKLASHYGIPVGRRTVLSHAEVQPTLGVAQKQKWDFTRLPPLPDLVGAHVIGDYLRDCMVRLPLETPVTVAGPDPWPTHALLRADVSTITTATYGGKPSGSIPAGTVGTLVQRRDDAIQVETPGGYIVWAPSSVFSLHGVADAESAAQPASTRQLLASIRGLIDDLETQLGDLS